MRLSEKWKYIYSTNYYTAMRLISPHSGVRLVEITIEKGICKPQSGEIEFSMKKYDIESALSLYYVLPPRCANGEVEAFK
jgi:hypothetical protein